MMAISPVTETLIQLFISAVVILASRKIILLYQARRRLPPGPFPLPVVGNLLMFMQKKFHHEIMNDIAAKYGPVFSFFLGHEASVFITDPEIGLQVLKKHTFAGRPQFNFNDWFFKDNSADIIVSDYGKEWEALRKVGHSAARKYALSPQLSPIVSDTVDRIIARAGNEPFDSQSTLNTMMIAILAQSAFGKKYEFEDPEFIKWSRTVEVLKRLDKFIALLLVVPFVKHIFRSQWRELMGCIHHQWEYVELMFRRAENRYTEGKNESFCDAIITARKEAEAEDNWMLPHLKALNIRNTVTDMFTAGTDTTRFSLRWIFLLMAKYPDFQERMRTTVQQEIGDAEPRAEDAIRCPLICAFISESMRFRYIAPTGLPHKTTVDEVLNGHKIPAGTTVFISIHNAMHNEKVWIDPHVFKPERFLDSEGKYISKPNPFFLPFSDGRRSCPGNKLAFNNLFLIVSRFLQKTKNIRVVGGVTEDHMRGDLSVTNGLEPTPYSLCLSV